MTQPDRCPIPRWCFYRFTFSELEECPELESAVWWVCFHKWAAKMVILHAWISIYTMTQQPTEQETR